MYAKNVTTFLLHLVREGSMTLDPNDEITRDTLIAKGGEVVNARVRQALGLAEVAG
jgi:NAD(P) transhydrogenase subunit alpha